MNQEVLEVLRQALGYGTGILGLPSTVASPKPVFPFPEGWLKDEATETELDQFSFWKSQIAEWHTLEAKRVGRKVSLLSKCRELVRFKDEVAMYFPTFIDWRGRMYFRSTIHPQLNDAVKGCLEFAEGKRLGTTGLYWLKVHVANCCGYDKHDPDIKVKWCEDNWAMIKHFIDNPFDIDAPEPDTAFTLLQAAFALRDAYELDNPEDYICHVPVAMDATCSGLQHLSALTRDEVGGKFTNLVDSGTDQKADIYLQVGKTAQEAKAVFIDDVVVGKFWDTTEITRSMSKKPVMTYVYGSTLLSTMDSIALDMASMGLEPIKDKAGKIVYTLNKLAIPVAKALRKGVEDTVPRCAEIMKYLQTVCRRSKTQHMQWVTPVGTPVVNWSENQVSKRLFIRSMGVISIVMKYGDGTYNVRAATQGVVPNFVHSMDSCHLCMTLNDFSGQVIPIHDSFGTHPSDVPELHKSLRKTFVELYSQYKIEDLLEVNNIDLEEYPVPSQGSLDIQDVNDSRFMFC